MHPTRSFERPSAEARFRILPRDASVDDVDRATRSAALSFVGGSASGWSRAELRNWFLLEYESATEHTGSRERHADADPTAGLTDDEVVRAVADVRARVVRMVESAKKLWQSPQFSREMIDARYVLVVYDRNAAQRFAASAHAEMRLVDRVTSLFIADFLNHPSDYDRVSVCESCGELQLADSPRHARGCTVRAKRGAVSGILARVRLTRDPSAT